MIRFKPDWSEVWTVEEAERELKDFKFHGPGWYHNVNGDTLLVVPFDRHPTGTSTSAETLWAQKAQPGERFEFNVYNRQESVASAFDAIINAPTRM